MGAARSSGRKAINHHPAFSGVCVKTGRGLRVAVRWQWRSYGRRHGRTGSRRNDNNAQLAFLNLPQSRARSRPFVPDVRPWSLPLTKPRHLQLAGRAMPQCPRIEGGVF